MMSSLLQHHGPVSRTRGIGLVAYKADAQGKGVEFETCPRCGRQHEVLYVFYRKPAGMFGNWVVFRYLGEEHVPDLSIPIRVPELPRGAKRMTTEQAARYWHGPA